MKGVNSPAIKGVTIDNVIEKIGGIEKLASAYNRYGLCPLPIFASSEFAEAANLFNLYKILDGTNRVATIAQAHELPNIYVEACNVITAEMKKIKAKQSDANK